MNDSVDAVVEQWREVLPSVNIEPASTMGRIHRISRLVQLRSSAILDKAGLTRGEFDVLAVLVRHGRAMAPTEIASTLSVSPAGMTKRLQKLLSSGLLLRRPHQKDRRSALLEITPRTQHMFPALLEAITAMETSVVAALPREERGALDDSLRTLLLDLESGGPEATERGAHQNSVA
ncbi:MarR family transcriptional regulator [Pseudarthrobacter sp. fls2-241-R2A-168]|uniref:MarR family winged helix-turn-helix transcriptional regulator n=1 Tax=Pseudarthrobacter sp. fls2-241-R2A-168 TaxID=3040304 RepID=UPI00255474A7|nr:MarR family transcriptional regulator [Pseudarthrobacter sp. fls2-241-R2A-168]